MFELRLPKTAKSLGRAILERVPWGVWRRLFPKDLVALEYHVVSSEDLSHLKYYHYKNRDQFEADVTFVTERFRSASYEEAAAHRLRDVKLPGLSFLFTFDDGFAECYDVIRPVLQAHGARGVFFITTDFVDDRALFFETRVSLCLAAVERMTAEDCRREAAALQVDTELGNPERRTLGLQRLTQARLAPLQSSAQRSLALWLLGLEADDEAKIDSACRRLGVDGAAYSAKRPLYLTRERVRQLASDGFTIGGHSLAHPKLQRMNWDQIEHQIIASCQMVRDLTGQEKIPFAFPYSGNGLDPGRLADLRRRHPMIELMFDTRGIRRNVPFIVDRVAADSPPALPGRQTNLPGLLREAWSHRQAWF